VCWYDILGAGLVLLVNMHYSVSIALVHQLDQHQPAWTIKMVYLSNRDLSIRTLKFIHYKKCWVKNNPSWVENGQTQQLG